MAAFHVRAVLLPDGQDPTELWVDQGRITFSPVPDAQELPGRFAAPGLVDAHIHLSLDFSGTGLPHGCRELVHENLSRLRRAGVLAVRDAGYAQQLDLDDIELPRSPVVLRSGWLTTPEGRFFPTERSGGLTVAKHTAAEDLISRVEEVAAAELPWCKIIADFPGADLNLFTAPPNYPIEVLDRAVHRAHELGVKVMTHTTGAFVSDLVAAGVDAIEHGMGVTTDVVQAMAQHDTIWVPTLASVENYLKTVESAGAPTEPREQWSARMTECLSLAVRTGVAVLVGSDELPHGHIVGEMQAMARHGMTAEQVVQAATTLGRARLGLPGLGEGQPADLVLFNQDPRDDLDEIGRPVAVIAAGELVADTESSHGGIP